MVEFSNIVPAEANSDASSDEEMPTVDEATRAQRAEEAELIKSMVESAGQAYEKGEFVFGRTLGAGAFAVVHEAMRKGKPYAVKAVSKAKCLRNKKMNAV